MNTFPPPVYEHFTGIQGGLNIFLPSSYMEVQKGSKPLDGSVEILRNV